MPTLDLVLWLDHDNRSSGFIRSTRDRTEFEFPKAFEEAALPLRIFCVAYNPTGGLASRLADADMADFDVVRVGIGQVHTPYAAESEFTWNADDGCYEGVLNLKTSQMATYLGSVSGNYADLLFEVQIKRTSPKSEYKFQAACKVAKVVLLDAAVDLDDVDDTLFADMLEPRFQDSDTVDVARTADEFKWHVRRKSDGGIGADTDGVFIDKFGMPVLDKLSASFTVASNVATPTDDEDVVTVGGFTGIVYQIRARVVGRVERKNHSGGTQLAGDDTHVYRDGTPSADNFNLWYLDISDPPQRIHHHATSPNTFDIDYEVDFKAKSGATVTLGFDTLDGLSYEANSVEVTQVMAEDAGPIGQQTIWIPAAAMTKRTTDGPADASSETTTNKVMVTGLEFDPDTPQYAQFTIAMPKSWDEGTVTAEFLWMASGGTGSARWGIQGRALSDGDVLDASFGTAQEVTDALGTVDTLRTTAATSAVTIAGTPATKDLVVFQVYRDADDVADTLDAAATLLGVRLLFTTDAENDN